MQILADLHIHSHFSRATSKELGLPQLHAAALQKGIQILGTGDFTHPGWLQEIENQLVPAEDGLFQLRSDLQRHIEQDIPRACAGGCVRFLLQAEICNIYKKNGKVRKNHNLVYMPSLAGVQRLRERLSKIGNLASDGRPILALDARDLLEMTLEADPSAFLIPAHIWTPWFSMLGSKSGFDSIQECFGDLSHHIFAVETGLSSDPPMNWRVGRLDGITLVSNSDAHSLGKIGREANHLDVELGYLPLLEALRTRKGFLGTIEFHPEQGKYHFDGHRRCGIRLSPEQTREGDGRCPVCDGFLTVGVSSRVLDLTDQPEGRSPQSARPYTSLISMDEVVGEVLRVGPNSRSVKQWVNRLLASLGPALQVLQSVPIEDIRRVGGDRLAEAIHRVRQGQLVVESGYDGEYGKVQIFTEEDQRKGG